MNEDFSIEIDTLMDEKLRDKLRRFYCERCKRWHSSETCRGCFLKIHVEIESEPSKFEVYKKVE